MLIFYTNYNKVLQFDKHMIMFSRYKKLIILTIAFRNTLNNYKDTVPLQYNEI